MGQTGQKTKNQGKAFYSTYKNNIVILHGSLCALTDSAKYMFSFEYPTATKARVYSENTHGISLYFFQAFFQCKENAVHSQACCCCYSWKCEANRDPPHKCAMVVFSLTEKENSSIILVEITLYSLYYNTATTHSKIVLRTFIIHSIYYHLPYILPRTNKTYII